MLFSVHLRDEQLATWPLVTEQPPPQPELLVGALAVQLTEGDHGVYRVRLISAYEPGNPHEDDHIIFHLAPRANAAEYAQAIGHIVDAVFTHVKPDFTGLNETA